MNYERTAFEIARLPAPPAHPSTYADAYWTVYTHLVRAKTPEMQRNLMRLLQAGAALEAASLIFHAAFPAYSYQVQGGRPGHIAMTITLDGNYRQISGPHRADCEGHSLLLASVRLAQALFVASGWVRHVG